MGCCFSSAAAASVDSSTRPSTAKVIGLDGSLTEYPVPLTASQVIIASAGDSFVCSSDVLFPDERIPALEPEAPLRSGQIYFVLPSTKLAYPLSASDMAALSMTASSALSSLSGKNQRRAKTWEMPVAEVDEAMCQIINESSGGAPAVINSKLLRRKPVRGGRWSRCRPLTKTTREALEMAGLWRPCNLLRAYSNLLSKDGKKIKVDMEFSWMNLTEHA
ncbi:uncharacterized protein LOC141825460 [Curcuma longa]|uniref:uncharacterized protein LOC141825460 n=1 Tax=Curcuma longa TaxID=136217 RepID=UPI003D9E789B